MKKFTVMCCVLLAAASLFAGARSDNAGVSGGSTDPVKVSVLRWGAINWPPDKDPILAALNKKLNLDIEFVGYGSVTDYTTQINTRIAAGSYPDLFWVNRELLNTYASRGIVLDLSEALKKELKPVADRQGEEVLMLGIANGRNYGIASTVEVDYTLDFIRQDWLDNLGMKRPGTLEEYFAVAQAFTDKDPDGNGRKDTFGLTGGGLGAFTAIFNTFGVGITDSALPAIYLKGGKLVSMVTDPDVKSAILAAKRFVDAGVVDPEVLANTSGTAVLDKAIQGRVGLVRISWAGFMRDEHIATMKTANPRMQWSILPQIDGGNGKALNGLWKKTSVNIWTLPAALVKDAAKLNGIYSLLNYMATPEGDRLVQYGVEGTHHKFVNGRVEKGYDKAWQDLSPIWVYQFLGRKEDRTYLSIRFPNQTPFIDFVFNEKRIEGLNAYVDYPSGFVASDATTFAQEELIKFIYGRRPIAEYDDFVNTLMNLYNFKAYMEKAETQLKSLGVLK